MSFKVDFCDIKAARYACVNWHYSKAISASKTVKFGVWEDDKFIGCVLFARGASPALHKSVGVSVLECCELTRVALTTHKTPVSKILSVCLNMLKKHCPNLKIVVSYADKDQGHHGGIYQATNWLYLGSSKPGVAHWIINGKQIHDKSVGDRVSRRGKVNRVKVTIENVKKFYKTEDVKRGYVKGKHKYIYLLDKELKSKFEAIKKPYPKRLKQAMDVPTSQRRCNADLAAPNLKQVE